MRIKTGVGFVLALLLVRAGSSFAVAEPRGYAEANFGMTVEQVKKLYPKMEVSTQANPTAALLPVARYQITDQKVGSMSGCKVILQFYHDTLMQAEIYCPDKDAVPGYLEGEYGPAESKARRDWFWYFDQTVISYNSNNGVFLIADKAANQALQTKLWSAIAKARAQEQSKDEKEGDAHQ